jgi:hypothetical protein
MFENKLRQQIPLTLAVDSRVCVRERDGIQPHISVALFPSFTEVFTKGV